MLAHATINDHEQLKASAYALIRERGDVAFTMRELAAHAGMSVTEVQNVYAERSQILRALVREEFEAFQRRLSELPETHSPLRDLLNAIDLVPMHYVVAPAFYRGLYQATLGSPMSGMREMMMAEGLKLWGQHITAAADAGEIERLLEDSTLTIALLRAMASTIQAWLVEGWDQARFSAEMTRTTRLVLLGLVNARERKSMLCTLANLPTARS